MKVRLEVSHNKANIKRILIQDDATIGRGKECNLRIASGQVSRKHCRISIRGDHVFVTDLGSANGTFVDGKQLPPDEATEVSPGQELLIGPAHFTFRFTATESSVATPRASETKPTSESKAANGAGTETESTADDFDDRFDSTNDTAEDQDKTGALDLGDSPPEEIRIDLSDPESDAVQLETDDSIELPIPDVKAMKAARAADEKSKAKEQAAEKAKPAPPPEPKRDTDDDAMVFLMDEKPAGEADSQLDDFLDNLK